MNLRPVVYCTAIRRGKEAEWSFLWKRYINSNVGAEKSMIISALSCTREQWLLNRYLGWSLNSTLVRKQDVTIVFSGVAGEEIGYHLARNFFFERIDDIYETWVFSLKQAFTESSRTFFIPYSLYPDTVRLSRYIKPLAEQMSTAKDLRELKDLITAKPKLFEKATQGVKQALETVALNNQWKINTYMDLSRRLNRMLLRDFDYNDLDDDVEEEEEKKDIWYFILETFKRESQWFVKYSIKSSLE